MSANENLGNKIKEFWPKNGPSTREVEKYIKKYSKEKIVIKCGGRVLLDPALLNSLIEDIVILKKLGLTPILVHGGGLGIKKKLDKLNIKSKFVMGLRVTDEKMIKIVENVMDEFNKEIIDALEKKSCKAKPITIKKNNIIYVDQENKELGYVGKPKRIDVKSLKEITDKWTVLFHSDCRELNMLPPHKEPRASDHIPQQIDLVHTLLEKDHAYQASDGSIYFKISTFPDYGKLTHLDRVELKTQTETSGDTHNLADEYERETVADFSLWKARKADDGDNYWASPWGEGRPGWHLRRD